VVVVLSSVVLLVVVSSSSADDDDELELGVSAGSLDVDVVAAAAVVFLLSDEVAGEVSVKVVLGVAFADVVGAVVDGSLSANSSAVSSASSILDCGIWRPASLHADASGVMKEESKDRISSGHL